MQALHEDIDKVSTSIKSHIHEQRAWRRGEEARQCLQTLRSKNMYEDQKTLARQRLPGTCSWFLNNTKFHEWSDSRRPGLLWVSADPGCGKSVLARSLVDKGSLTPNPQGTTVCYFFFKDIPLESWSICKTIAAILHHLLSKKASLAGYAASTNATNGSELLYLSSTMWEILIKAAADSEVGEIVCVLDAIDECEEAQYLKLIKMIRTFYSDLKRKSVNKNTLREIGIYFHALLRQFLTIYLSGDEESDVISDEIEYVMRFEVAAIAPERSFDAKTKNFLLEQLLKVENRTYLWLHLVLDEIRTSDRAGTAKEVHKDFLSIPQSVSSTYEKILEKAMRKPKRPSLVSKLLHIIIGAKTPMPVREGSDAFAMRIRNICGLFIHRDRSWVYLIHKWRKVF